MNWRRRHDSGRVRFYSTLSTFLALAIGAAPAFCQVIYPTADVFVETSVDGLITTTYDGYAAGSQIAFGLGAANGTSTGRRRSYLQFTLGTNSVSSAKLKLYNYWGSNMGGGGNPTVSGTLKLLGSGAIPIQFSEPASSPVTTWVPPADSGFTTIVNSLAVNPGALSDPVGWYEFDVTSWYNSRLGRTTTLLLRGAFTGYDFPIFEDREGTAYNNHSDNAQPGTGPRIDLNNTNSVPPLPPPLAAFPGAEGFGAYARGGRGGDVYYVSNLNDSGPGSLRDGIDTASGPRTIVFNVSGNIVLQSILYVDRPYITIAGQTAPGDGICLRDYSLNIANTHDVIIRGLRIRRGDVQVRASGKPTGSVGLDTVSIDDSSNVIFDHCSLSWSCDEIFGIVQNRNVTVQWCVVSEPLGDPSALIHPYGTNHAYAMNCSATTLSVHHNLIAKYIIRGPQFEANDAVSGQGYEVWMEAVNNVLFDYSGSGSRYRTGVEEGAGNIPFRFHFIKNMYIRNPSRTGAQEIEALTNFGVTNTVKVYVSGNIGPNRRNDSLDQWALVMLDDNNTPIRQAPANIQAQMSDAPLFTVPVPVTTDTASNSYPQVVSLAGANNVRDAVDLRVVGDVVHRHYTDFLQSQSQVGGWPPLNTYNVPADTDHDGIPDYWESAVGLNPNVANNNHTNSDGYTDLEQYLNWLADLHVVGMGNSFVDLDLRRFTTGMASNPLYTVSRPTNGVVNLLDDGHTARFTPWTNFFGRASFEFVSVDSFAGMTNTVGVLISRAPRFSNISVADGKVVMSGTGGTPFGGYYAQTTTNLGLSPNFWTAVATNQFDFLGNFSLTNLPGLNVPQMFYRLRLP